MTEQRTAMEVIAPDWPVSAAVRAFATTRRGGVSAAAWGTDGGEPCGLNLGAACGDDPERVLTNRARLRGHLPADPCWLDQVHGNEVIRVSAPATASTWFAPKADAAVTARPGIVLAVLTADCLPVLIADRRGRAVGAAHAGWRGLAGGVIENTVSSLRALLEDDADLVAWLGPAIGSRRFEVGEDVFEAFTSLDPRAAAAFCPAPATGKYLADLFLLARQRLQTCGIENVSGGQWCTASDPDRFYSYRRDRETGRMATLVWLES